MIFGVLSKLLDHFQDISSRGDSMSRKIAAGHGTGPASAAPAMGIDGFPTLDRIIDPVQNLYHDNP